MKKYVFLFLSPFLLLASDVQNGPATNTVPEASAEPKEEPLPIWRLPWVWQQHSQLRKMLIDTLQRGDISAMESVCRQAIKIIPGDATWHYNLACALAYRATPDLALEELDKAINFGFRNADAISKDQDLARIQSAPRFKELVKKARVLADLPVPGRPRPQATPVVPGGTLLLNETNLVWNFDTGVFDAQLTLAEPSRSVAEQALNYGKSQKTHGPEWASLVAWLSEGTAAGNTGDLYVNRDRGHSSINVADFPNLTRAVYCKESEKDNADIMLPHTHFGNFTVVGNISRAYLHCVNWRSTGRFAMTEPGMATRMDLLYHSNQFWVIPSVNDFGKPEIGDVFPGAAPFQFISHGISWSDLPFVSAAFATSAAFRPPTKKEILKQRLMGPTLQWLLRRTRKGVRSEDDYLSPKAHPTAFDAASLDMLRLVEMAHELRPEQIPPAVSLVLINSNLFPVKYPQPGRDYPDIFNECLYQTASSTAFFLRAPEAKRTFLARAVPFPKTDDEVHYTWHVVHGDASVVKIEAPIGESLNTPERGFAQITIDRRSLTNRIDIACFAKRKGTTWGAPSFFSFSPIAQEKRTYRADGKIECIDYSNLDSVYSDPITALPRRWKDTYSYSSDGTPLGWTRSFNGKNAASFTPSGDRILERNPDGTPAKAVHVKYISRGTGDPAQPIELTYIDDGEPFIVK